MKILITGHLGYLGSEFIGRCGTQYEITGYDIQDGDDLLNLPRLIEQMRGCEVVVHLAAIPRPVPGKSIEDYFDTNILGTFNVMRAALTAGVKRVVYGSSTTVYGVEKGIPFSTPISEGQKFVSQYLSADELSMRECDLSYHVSKTSAEQLVAWYGLNKKLETVALRFGPINKVFLGTSVSIENATQGIRRAIDCSRALYYEAFSIVDDLPHIDNSKAREVLEYEPEPTDYSGDQLHSNLDDRTQSSSC